MGTAPISNHCFHLEPIPVDVTIERRKPRALFKKCCAKKRLNKHWRISWTSLIRKGPGSGLLKSSRMSHLKVCSLGIKLFWAYYFKKTANIGNTLQREQKLLLCKEHAFVTVSLSLPGREGDPKSQQNLMMKDGLPEICIRNTVVYSVFPGNLHKWPPHLPFSCLRLKMVFQLLVQATAGSY